MVPSLICIALSSSHFYEKARLPRLKSRGRVTLNKHHQKNHNLHNTTWRTTRCHRRHLRTRSRPTPRARPFSNPNDMAHSRPSPAHHHHCSPVTTLAKHSISRIMNLRAFSRTSVKVLGMRPITAIRPKTLQNPRRLRCRATMTPAST